MKTLYLVGACALSLRSFVCFSVFFCCVAVRQLRREVRLRREYLYRKAQEDRLRTIEEKKLKLKDALDSKTA